MIGLPLAETQEAQDTGPDVLSEASSELNSMDTFLNNWWRDSELKEANENGIHLNPRILNQLYKDVEQPFTKPMSEQAAMLLNEEGVRRKQLQEAMAQSPGGDFYKGAVNFAQGLIVHAMDPVEFGAGAVGGWAFQGAGVLMSRATAPVVSTIGKTLAKGGFAFDAAEGVASNAALEPYMIASAEQAQIDYGWEDSAMNVIGGGLAFPVLKYVGGRAIDNVKALPRSLQDLSKKAGLGQIYNDKVPNVEAVKQAYDDVAYNSPKPETADVKITEEPATGTEPKLTTKEEPSNARASYRYEPKTAQELSRSPMYAASKQAGTLDGGSKPVGDLRFGDDGLYITDNPNAANNIAAHPLDTDGPHGDVFEFDSKYTKFVDLDITGRELFDELEIENKDLKKILNESDDVLEAYDKLSEDAEISGDESLLIEFRKAIHDAGYDGFKFSDDVQGHNSAYVFPESSKKLTQKGMIKSDPSSVKMPDQAKLAEAQAKVMSQTNEIHHDPVLQQEFDQFVPEDVDTVKRAEEVIESLKVLEDLERSGVITDKAELDAIKKFKENKVKGDSMVKVIEDFTACILAGAD
jgi:hypothetical protein